MMPSVEDFLSYYWAKPHFPTEFFTFTKENLNPIQDGPFWGCSQMGDGGAKRRFLPKICQTYPTIMKLGTIVPYLKKIQKHINHVTHPLASAFFHQKSATFVISRIFIAFSNKISHFFNFLWGQTWFQFWWYQ